MDILIPLGCGSRWDDNELRFCLRSVEKYLTGVDKVYIIGDLPGWIKNIIHIPFNDIPGGQFRDYNIFLKVMAGCEVPELSEDFLFMSDDHFFMQSFEAAQFPFYYRELLENSIASYNPHQPYYSVLENTYKVLSSWRKPTKDFQVHCPIRYNKKLFLGSFPVQWPDYGYALKSIYCNLHGITGQVIPDLKVKDKKTKQEIYAMIDGRPFFSMGNRALQGDIALVLNELFPSPSKYEL